MKVVSNRDGCHSIRQATVGSAAAQACPKSSSHVRPRDPWFLSGLVRGPPPIQLGLEGCRLFGRVGLRRIQGSQGAPPPPPRDLQRSTRARRRSPWRRAWT